MTTITTRTDLAAYIADTMANHSAEEQRIIVELLRAGEHPQWGDDWDEYLDEQLTAACEMVIAATARVSEDNGVSTEDAAAILVRLGNDAAMVEAVAEGNAEVGYWDDTTVADRTCGHTGWVAWFAASETAITVSNGDPEGHEGVESLSEAVKRVTRGSRLARAAAHIDAVDLGDGGWAYHADETSSWWVITSEELEELCDYLDSDEPMIAGDAYSHWCAGCGGEEQPSWWSPEQRTQPEAESDDVTDEQIAALRDEAAQAGDLDQVAICERALAGDAAARAECARVIDDAQAADDES